LSTHIRDIVLGNVVLGNVCVDELEPTVRLGTGRTFAEANFDALFGKVVAKQVNDAGEFLVFPKPKDIAGITFVDDGTNHLVVSRNESFRLEEGLHGERALLGELFLAAIELFDSDALWNGVFASRDLHVFVSERSSDLPRSIFMVGVCVLL